MRVLALETATDFAGFAIVAPGINHAPVVPGANRVKSEEIMTFIARTLKDVNLDLKDINLLAVGIGPGFYTGIRIGLSLMKGLAMAAQKPLVGIPTLDTIACNFSDSKDSKKKVVTLLNAYGGEVYGALYHPGGQAYGAAPKRCSNYFVGHIENFLKRLSLVRKLSNRVIFAGTGLNIYQKEIENILGHRAVFAPQELWIPQPGSLAKLAIERFKKGRLPHPDKILPLYLKKSEAERRWKKR